MRTRNRPVAPVLLAASVIAVTGVLAGCGTQHAGNTADTASRVVGVTPEQRAEQDTAAILRAFPVPPGAVQANAVPIPSLAQPAERPASQNLVTKTGWWRVPGQIQAVDAWLSTHRPAGFALAGTAVEGGTGYRELQPRHPAGNITLALMFSLPDVRGVLTSRLMVIALAPGGKDQTVIRVDAEAVWLPARPAAERIPATVSVVTITPVAGLNPLPAGARPVTITSRAQVVGIAAAVNALPVYPPGTYRSCPADFGRLLRLTFRDSAAGPEVAVVSASVTGCELVAVSVGGRAQPELGGGDAGSRLAQRVEQIAGISWPGF